jgi:hypothetical protein
MEEEPHQLTRAIRERKLLHSEATLQQNRLIP